MKKINVGWCEYEDRENQIDISDGYKIAVTVNGTDEYIKLRTEQVVYVYMNYNNKYVSTGSFGLDLKEAIMMRNALSDCIDHVTELHLLNDGSV
jgi:hypothetical protein